MKYYYDFMKKTFFRRNTVISILCLCAFLTSNAVTFKVSVPEGTKACFVTGEFNSWSPDGALRMNNVSENYFELEIGRASGRERVGPEW